MSEGTETIVCTICGTEFISYRSNYRIYCSIRCYSEYRRRSPRKPHQRLRGAWRDMKSRCETDAPLKTEYYSGRGITVCDEWKNSFAAFRDWALANGYQDGLELDRKDPNGNYEPNNCRWATRPQQMRNTRKRRDGFTSKYKGVCRHSGGKWVAQISLNSRNKYLGLFEDEISAAKAYDAAAYRASGQFALLNFPEHYAKEDQNARAH